jgi:hypothetical protein
VAFATIAAARIGTFYRATSVPSASQDAGRGDFQAAIRSGSKNAAAVAMRRTARPL